VQFKSSDTWITIKTEKWVTVKFRPKYTIQTNLNLSLTIRTFAILGSTTLTFKVQFRIECLKILQNRCGTELKKLRGTVLLSQSSLGNAMEVCSAIENDLILTRAGCGMSNELIFTRAGWVMFGVIQHEGWVTYRI